MIYSLLVVSSPVSGHGSRHAVEFARCLLLRGHSIYRVFFLDAGVMSASSGRVLPQDETDYSAQWVQLSEQHNVDLVICVSSALRYGMLSPSEAQRYERASATIQSVFTVSGLGQLIDAYMHSDRLVTFGG